MKKLTVIALVTMFSLAACSSTAQPAGVIEDRAAAAQTLDQLNDSQPVPDFRWSQIRQNLIEITAAQAETTQTTSFFFNLGVADPIAVCPSIGFPIPTTAQLTNPSQAIGDIGHNGGGVTVSQVEQTGIYTGESTGTYVICIDATGAAYAQYWEGFVSTVSGPAEWDKDGGTIDLIGPPSFEFTSSN